MATEDDLDAASTNKKDDKADDEGSTESKPAEAVSKPESPPADEGEAAAPPVPVDEGDKDAAEPEPAETEAAPSPAPAPKASPPPIKGARWAEPIASFERRWTWLESRLLTFVLMSQLAALVAWVFLSGIASPPSADAGGTVFRSLIAAIVLGIGGWLGTSKLPLEKRRMITIAGITIGVCFGLILRPSADTTSGIRYAMNKALSLDRVDAFLVNYFNNIKGWLQESSTLTLMGGLRGLATRLTLGSRSGASLATAAGKHIHIDVIFRFLPERFRIPAAVINACAAATVCVAGAWGFIDHLAIESFNAKADDTAGTKISQIAHHMGQHAFLARKQIGLDLRTLPHVLANGPYDRAMTAGQWNQWVKEGGFEDHYKPDEVASILVPEDAGQHIPLIVAPNGDAARGMLVHTLNFVFPFGLFAIALRFLLRAILMISGHIQADPNAAHKEELHGATHESAKVGGA